MADRGIPFEVNDIRVEFDPTHEAGWEYQVWFEDDRIMQMTHASTFDEAWEEAKQIIKTSLMGQTD